MTTTTSTTVRFNDLGRCTVECLDCGKVLDMPASISDRRDAKHDHCVTVHGHPSCGSRFRDITVAERERMISASYGPRNRAGLVGYASPHRLHDPISDA